LCLTFLWVFHLEQNLCPNIPVLYFNWVWKEVNQDTGV